jgi:hypothetical protein
MKVAVCYSGQIRGDYVRNISRMKKILPKADYFFCSWENQRDKDEAGLINRFHIEPKPTYNPAQAHSKKYIKLARAIIDGKIKREHFPPRWKGKDDAGIKEEFEATILGRNKSWHHMKQHLGHAMVVRDFVNGKGYDVVIRLRYDCMPMPQLKCFIQEFCEQVYKHGNPMGFHDNNRAFTLEHSILPERKIETNAGHDLNDFMVIHRENLFDPERTFWFYNQKKLGPAEGGWYQIMCEPYELVGITVGGFVRLENQHNNQSRHVANFRNNVLRLNDAEKPGDRSIKYQARELIQESSSDVYVLLDKI